MFKISYISGLLLLLFIFKGLNFYFLNKSYTYFCYKTSEMSNGSILHKRLGLLYNVGDYELFHFDAVEDKNIEQKQDNMNSQISRMIYQRHQYKVCASDEGLPLMVRFGDKVNILYY